MSNTVTIWQLTGTPRESPAHLALYYTATKADAMAIVREHELAGAEFTPVKIPLNRYGIAQALQGVLDDACYNEV